MVRARDRTRINSNIKFLWHWVKIYCKLCMFFFRASMVLACWWTPVWRRNTEEIRWAFISDSIFSRFHRLLGVLQLLSHPSVSGSVMVTYLPSTGELAAIKQLGNMTPEKLATVREEWEGAIEFMLVTCHVSCAVCTFQSIDFCVEGCTRIHQRVKDFLKKNAENKTWSFLITIIHWILQNGSKNRFDMNFVSVTGWNAVALD